MSFVICFFRLGEGYFGVVSKGKWRGTDVAVKRLKEHIVLQDYSDAYKIFRREVIMYRYADYS